MKLWIAIFTIMNSAWLSSQSDELRKEKGAATNEVVANHVERIGLQTSKPATGRFVKTKFGYMVPFKTSIPGSKVEFEMVPVPGGKFWIGSSPNDEDAGPDEQPNFEVEISPFWIGKYEVTWAEYKLYMNLDQVFKEFQSSGIRTVKDNRSVDAITAPSSLYDPSFTFEAGDEPNEPAATMTQFAAKQYTKWLSCISNDFYRLPTEAEWEYACRAGTKTRFYFGDDVAELEEHAWYIENSEELRHAVGKLKPNPWGLHDMYGNVAEWVLDQYDEKAYKKLAGKSVDWKQAWNQPTKVFPRVLRGGSWELEAEDCRSSARIASSDEWKDEDPNYPQSPWWFTTSPGLGTGLRVIRPLVPPESKTEKEKFWGADHRRIFKDAKNRIIDNGRGAFGIVDEKLPAAIKELKNK